MEAGCYGGLLLRMLVFKEADHEAGCSGGWLLVQ